MAKRVTTEPGTKDEEAPVGKKVLINPDGKRLHTATFAADEYTGQWKIRIAGPTPNRFSNKVVPVRRADGTETDVQLLGLAYYDETWVDEATGGHVALYFMQKQKRKLDDEIPF